MKGNPINWFEIPVTDMQRAVNFYSGVFDCAFQVAEAEGNKHAFFPMDPERYGAGGMLMQSECYLPSDAGIVIYFSVDDIDAVLAKVEKHGGETIFPKRDIGQYGFIAHFKDCEGNRIGLHSMR